LCSSFFCRYFFELSSLVLFLPILLFLLVINTIVDDKSVFQLSFFRLYLLSFSLFLLSLLLRLDFFQETCLFFILTILFLASILEHIKANEKKGRENDYCQVDHYQLLSIIKFRGHDHSCIHRDTNDTIHYFNTFYPSYQMKEYFLCSFITFSITLTLGKFIN
jgi:hypothetical protein